MISILCVFWLKLYIGKAELSCRILWGVLSILRVCYNILAKLSRLKSLSLAWSVDSWPRLSVFAKSLKLIPDQSNSLRPKYWFCFLLKNSKSSRRLPVTMDSSRGKTPSNVLPDRTAHGRVSSNQRASIHDVIMPRQKPPASSYYGTCPFKFTNSYNSVTTNSIKVHLGLNDGKICPLYVNTRALFLQGLAKSHSILDLSRGVHGVRSRPTLPNLTLLYWSV